jgi:hypothetical protein
MADNNFRSYRGRDAAAPARTQADDPLAELARLIGQTEPAADHGHDAPRSSALDQAPGGLDWAAEERYADEPAEDDYDERAEARYAPTPQADLLPAFRPGPPSYNEAYEQPADSQYSPPARGYNGADDGGLPERPRFHDEPEPARSLSRQPPGFLSQSFDDRDYDDPDQEDAADQAYALEDYEEEPPAGRRRSGLIVVAAVLGLAVLGTAGAFAYRAMFGSSMLPSLPPIIKAEDGPNKIVPNKPKSNASDQADAGATSGEKLVSREEQPVDVPAPPSTAPRVVSTVPIFPDPNSGQAGVPSSAQGAALGSQPAAMAPPPVQTDTAPASPAPSIWPPASSTAAAATSGTASAAGAPAPRKIHTVIIRTDQMGAATADASAASPPAPAALAPPPLRTAPARAAVQQARPAPAAPRVEGNGPLSITPDQSGAAPAPARTRTALARPELNAPERTEPAPAAGGYAVQVTSQRSEAGAQAEFRALRAKYPGQLGNHEPIIRRADLGAKGVYYRALVPFASMDQATGMCTSLKAAGGSCIVQRD